MKIYFYAVKDLSGPGALYDVDNTFLCHSLVNILNLDVSECEISSTDTCYLRGDGIYEIMLSEYKSTIGLDIEKDRLIDVVYEIELMISRSKNIYFSKGPFMETGLTEEFPRNLSRQELGTFLSDVFGQKIE